MLNVPKRIQIKKKQLGFNSGSGVPGGLYAMECGVAAGTGCVVCDEGPVETRQRVPSQPRKDSRPLLRKGHRTGQA